ncbi:MAG: SPASM domain-containing protein [Lachnospiraceae bacterium]|nr:SPASM domain-containing protein [Lachnospiraceae bacterium]
MKMNNIVHTFNIGNNKYAFDYRNILFCLLDEDTEEALRFALSGNSLSEAPYDSAPTLNALIKSGYFISEYPDSPVPEHKYDILNISFAPVNDCNFLCKYCYAKGGEGTSHYQTAYDEEKVDKMLRSIYMGKYAHFINYKFDFVSGGEPLLDFDILDSFLRKLREYDKELNKNTTVLIVTNGTLLNEEIIRKLDEYDVFLGISVDGPREVHNRHRVYKDGRNTFDDVAKGISLLRSSPVVSSKLKDAWAMAVITRETGSLVDVMETCVNLGFKRMQMQLIREVHEHPLAIGKDDIKRVKEHYKDLFTHIISFAEKGDLSRIKMIANGNDSFGKFLSRLLLRTPVYYRCFAGKNKIAVTASGEIYPCDSFCGLNNYSMGTIDENTDNESVTTLFEEAHIQNRTKCSKCWARHICGGDCYYNSYLISGNILEPDPIKCEINRFFIENAIEMLIKIKMINPNHIEYIAKILRLN